MWCSSAEQSTKAPQLKIASVVLRARPRLFWQGPPDVDPGSTLFAFPSERQPMKKEMLINVIQPEECRIAIVEDGVLEELYVERSSRS